LKQVIVLSHIRPLLQKRKHTTAPDGSLVILYEDNVPYRVEKADVVVR